MHQTKQIVVESVIGAHYFQSPVPWACISIVTEEDTWPRINEANRVGLLQLAFADIAVVEGKEERAFSRVERWRGGLGFGIVPYRGFPVCASIAACRAPFPPPAHRTGRAVFPHPALGQGITRSPAEVCAVAPGAQ